MRSYFYLTLKTVTYSYLKLSHNSMYDLSSSDNIFINYYNI